jgi:anti-sigma factor RsiW
MTWNHTNTEERLSDYLDGALTPAEAAAFKAHADSCADCGALVASVSGLVTRMHALELEPAPPMLMNRILDATVGPRKEKQSWKSWLGWTGSFVQPRFVMGLVTVAATVLVVIYSTGFTPSKLKKVNLSPVEVYRAANREVHLKYGQSVKYVNDLRVVYEIQSRLQPANQPSPEQNPMPMEQEQQKTPNPQEKSQSGPKPGHSQTRMTAMLASALEAGWMAAYETSGHATMFAMRTQGSDRSAR